MLRKKDIILYILLVLCILAQSTYSKEKNNESNFVNAENQLNRNLLLMKQDFHNYLDKSLYSENSVEQKDYKSPWLAFGLSFLLPGLGQIYNGDYTKAIIQMAVVLSGIGLISLTGCTECGDPEPLQSTLFYTGLGLSFSGYIWSILDAPISASNYNERNDGLTLYSTKRKKFTINLQNSFQTGEHYLQIKINF